MKAASEGVTGRPIIGRFKSAVVAGALFFSLGSSAALAEISVIRDGTSHEALFALDFDGQNGFAVGAPASIFQTTDGGASWELLPRPTSAAFFGVTTSAGETLIVGQQGLVLKRDGDAWRTIETPTGERLLNVHMIDDGLAAAVGGFGTIIVSEDRGETWTQADIDWIDFNPEGLEPHIYDVHIGPGDLITVIAEFELVVQSRDRGVTWTRAHVGEPSLFAMHVEEDGSAFAVGQEGAIVRTDAIDGGTWESLSIPEAGEANLLGIWGDGQGQKIITGIRKLLVSDDGGATWTSRKDADIPTAWYQAIGAPDGDTVPVTVGHRGRILKVRP
ncbi:MAG: YCF48-related protein [Pseudomonadota bacterium]